MRKLPAMILLLMIAVMPMQAKLRFGVRGGYNITQMSFSKDVIESSNKEGFFVGPVLNVSLPAGLGFELAGLYDQRDAELEGETISQKTINVPLNLRLNLGMGSSAGIFLAAGPQVAFNIGDKDFSLKSITDGGAYDEARTYRLRDSNFSVNLGGGVFLTNHFELGCTYNLAIGKTGEVRGMQLKEELDKTHAHAWQVFATFYF